MSKKTVGINSIIFGQIRHRYEMVKYEFLTTNQKSYGIIDSIYPYEKFKQESVEKIIQVQRAGTIAISDRIAKEMNVPVMNILDLVSIFGYTKTNLRELLLAVKKKNLIYVLSVTVEQEPTSYIGSVKWQSLRISIRFLQMLL